MKIRSVGTARWILGALLCLTACGGPDSTTTPEVTNLEQGFQNPADAYKPHTFWHWMNRHVTRESITRDLEEMKRVGM